MKSPTLNVHARIRWNDIRVIRLHDSSFTNFFDGNVCGTGQESRLGYCGVQGPSAGPIQTLVRPSWGRVATTRRPPLILPRMRLCQRLETNAREEPSYWRSAGLAPVEFSVEVSYDIDLDDRSDRLRHCLKPSEECPTKVIDRLCACGHSSRDCWADIKLLSDNCIYGIYDIGVCA